MGIKLFFHFEEHRLVVFQNRVLRGIFVPKGAEVMGEMRRQYNEEFLSKYYCGDQIKIG
jgi:hypothetical protein